MFQTWAMANCPVWLAPWEPQRSPTIPTASPIALLRWRAWMLLASESWCLEPEPMTGNCENAECSRRCASEGSDPATMPTIVTNRSRSGKIVRKP